MVVVGRIDQTARKDTPNFSRFGQPNARANRIVLRVTAPTIIYNATLPCAHQMSMRRIAWVSVGYHGAWANARKPGRKPLFVKVIYLHAI